MVEPVHFGRWPWRKCLPHFFYQLLPSHLEASTGHRMKAVRPGVGMRGRVVRANKALPLVYLSLPLKDGCQAEPQCC